MRAPDAESLAFFLAERYCCFARGDEALYSIRIYHHPWILREAQDLAMGRCTILSAMGLPEPTATPLAHFSEPVEVEIWPPIEVGLAEANAPVQVAR